MSDFNIQDSNLGKSSSVPEQYDSSLLFRIPRSENRIRYNIAQNNLPFTGVDVWNCYEVSFLTDKGLPISGVLKIVYPADSVFLVESKSLKLYLNSFNMEKLGNTFESAEKNILNLIQKDLQNLLETKVALSFFTKNKAEKEAFSELDLMDLYDMIGEENLYKIEINSFKESPELLKSQLSGELHEYAFRTNILRSNCRVTNQPDWGDLFVKMQTKHIVDLRSVFAYLVSFRKENHFHEEVVEMIYKRFDDFFMPNRLVVAAMYTRRGGIDINPIRASHKDLLDNAFINPDVLLKKTLRQ